jgi:hypothetical protein
MPDGSGGPPGFTVGDPPIAVALRHSSRARRMTLRVSGPQSMASLTIPPHVSLGEARDFALRQEGWLRRTLAKRPVVRSVGLGVMLPWRGEVLELAPGDGRGVRRDGRRLLIPGDSVRTGARALGWLRAEARADIALAVARYTALLGRSASGITLRDTRGRWGSCSAEGRLMFSWRLIMAPPSVLDYVVAHEVAHLRVMNHSPRFWSEVKRLKPDYEADRSWLRRHGPGLHAWDFA